MTITDQMRGEYRGHSYEIVVEDDKLKIQIDFHLVYNLTLEEPYREVIERAMDWAVAYVKKAVDLSEDGSSCSPLPMHRPANYRPLIPRGN